MKGPCNICRKNSGLFCSACKSVFYCSAEHQKEDWQHHKPSCKLIVEELKKKEVQKEPQSKALEVSNPLLQENIELNEAPGTFRWLNIKLEDLPKFPLKWEITNGWKEYFQMRFSGSSIPLEIKPYFVDALSYPMTIIYILSKITFINEISSKEINILLVGSTSKAEVRIYKETNYFLELNNFFPDIKKFKLFFIGLEINENDDGKTLKKSDKLIAGFKKDSSYEFLKNNSNYNPKNTLIIGLNTGLGCGYKPVMESWKYDLKKIMENKYTLALTTTNDTTDLSGELAVMKKLNANFILYPMKNPFEGMTRYYGAGEKETGWYTNSDMIYAIKGLV